MQMTPYIEDEAVTTSPKIDAAIVKLRDEFDWDAPVTLWRPAKIAGILGFLRIEADRGALSVYGRAVLRLNGGRRTYKGGYCIVQLPPVKPKSATWPAFFSMAPVCTRGAPNPPMQPGEAREFLRRTFAWDTPSDQWRPAKVERMLRYFGMDDSRQQSIMFGREICALNGGLRKRSHGVNWTYLPPVRA